MSQLEHGGAALGRVHADNNAKKYFCHFTGFLEGIAASGYLETGEVEPLIAECIEFVQLAEDFDALDIIEDFKADIIEYGSILDAVEVRLEQFDDACAKSVINRFLGLCRGIACDGIITLEEARKLREQIRNKPELRKVIGVRQIETSVEDALQDGIVTPLESEELCNVISQVVGDCYADTGIAQTGGVANYEEFRISDIEVDLLEKTVVLTGTFKDSPRRLFEQKLEELGADVARAVSRKTDFIIIGGEAARDWIELNRGTKIRKAQELRLKTMRPDFISEGQILSLIG